MTYTTCKLCRSSNVPVHETKKMCSLCVSSMKEYRIHADKEPKSLTDRQRYIVKSLNGMFESNKIKGYYVPEFIKNGVQKIQCPRCDSLHDTKVNRQLCLHCDTDNRNYAVLVSTAKRKRRYSQKLYEMTERFTTLRALDKNVPQLFVDKESEIRELQTLPRKERKKRRGSKDV